MADHIYDATNDNLHEYLGKGFGEWRLMQLIENDQGLKIGVYYKITGYGETSYTVVNAGSATPVLEEYGLSLNDYNGTISTYIVKGELLNATLGGKLPRRNSKIYRNGIS